MTQKHHRLPLFPDSSHAEKVGRIPLAVLPPVVRPSTPLLDSVPDLVGTTFLLVGDLARAAGKTVRAIHLYEEVGLLRPDARSKGRYRLYGPEALTRVRWITKLQELGLTLSEITDLARDWGMSESAPAAASQVRDVFVARLQQTREQLTKLRELERELEESLHYLDECGAVCAPVRAVSHCPSCELHCHHDAPDLVRGVRAG